ncbi:hypothetical protein [Chitinophaga sp. Cy-1792]|uniref:DUF922 domain-containing protein n=1 Tax=Chitinophaga sp. Cy-1792 TaxID=2608339 RepID=UPI001423E708|nr:hypothetical protein [Chitinophaga sp. Cy-1792]NIG52382.1 hypothetical protein [Chitinophaga sp. Cy-1792]
MREKKTTVPVSKNPVVQLDFYFQEQPDSADLDTVFYSPFRKLTWNDFKGKPSSDGPSAALSYTSFSYEGSSRIYKDTLHISLQLQVFFIKSASWVRPEYETPYVLNHEQLHFDITRVVVERFKQRLKQTPLNRDDYDSVIQFQYLEAFREMNRLQYAFDRETHNGLNAAAQAVWHDKIAMALKNNGNFPEELGNDINNIQLKPY